MHGIFGGCFFESLLRDDEVSTLYVENDVPIVVYISAHVKPNVKQKSLEDLNIVYIDSKNSAKLREKPLMWMFDIILI